MVPLRRLKLIPKTKFVLRMMFGKELVKEETLIIYLISGIMDLLELEKPLELAITLVIKFIMISF